jgi:two-component sensor histidine kinase
LRERIAALGRAHEFVRPHSVESRPTIGRTTLGGMLRELFEPYPALDTGNITIFGDDVPVDDKGATPFALLFHELATNAVKYGALSKNDGKVAISIAIDGEDVVVIWKESGGPTVASAPERTGFGSRLSEVSVRNQLAGDLERAWEADGLRLTVRVPVANLSRGDVA